MTTSCEANARCMRPEYSFWIHQSPSEAVALYVCTVPRSECPTMSPPTINTTRYDALRRFLRNHPRRWLVTGAAGFIGSHCAATLLELGQHVVAVDSLVTGHLANLDDVRRQVGAQAGRLDFVHGDVADAGCMREVLRGVDHVLHQAGLGSVPRSIERPEDTHAANVDGFVTLGLAAARADVRSMVYASSAAVYGDDPALPKRETDVPRPMTPYAASKQINEVYAAAFSHTYGLHTVGLRYFNITGPRQDPAGAYASVVPRWMSLLARRERPTIFGDGSATRDYCPVENVVQANLLAACSGPKLGPVVYNVGLGRSTDLTTLFRVVRDAVARVGAECGQVQPRFGPPRGGDIVHSVADITRARRDLGYAPAVDLVLGLQRTADWFLRSSDERLAAS